jgi:DNA-binding beta-propeller fold protein YncE
MDSKDVLYVIDTLNYRIQELDTNLKFLSSWGSQEQIGIKVYMPHEIAVDKESNVFLSDRQNHRIAKFTKDGKLLMRWGEFGEAAKAPGGKFSEPHGIAVGPQGSLFVSDRYNYRIQEFNPAGKFVDTWYTEGPKVDAEHYVLGVAVDTDGNVYVTDQYRHSVQKYSARKAWAPRATDADAPGRDKIRP